MEQEIHKILDSSYICKVANKNEIAEKFDYEIERASFEDKLNWKIWKENAIMTFERGERKIYFGVLDNKIITEAHAGLSKNVCQNSDRLVDEKSAYLFAFRTLDEFQGQGYFSKLFNFILKDLKQIGYTRVTIGVEPEQEHNLNIYHHFGFDKFIKRDYEVEPDGSKVLVDYYEMKI